MLSVTELSALQTRKNKSPGAVHISFERPQEAIHEVIPRTL